MSMKICHRHFDDRRSRCPRCGSRSARELDVSSSALSHSIAGLEDRLHVRLFNRTTRSVALTAAGETFVAEVTTALAVIDGATVLARHY
jgi:DNA-binding transcriptional LysR family regulator